jgi:hypothetical protein
MTGILKRSKMKRWLMAGMLVGALVWTYHMHRKSLGPVIEREQANRLRLTELNGQLERANEVLHQARVAAAHANNARMKLAGWSEDSSSRPVLVWFPERLKAHLRKFEISNADIRLNSEVPEPGVKGFKRTYWHVHLPPQDGLLGVVPLLRAVAEIEREERFVRVLDCSVLAGSEELRRPGGTLNIEALIRE